MSENNMITPAPGISPIVNPQKRGFCVALQKGGKTVWVDGDSPEEFTSVLNDAGLAWVNFTVNDINNEGEAIATALGFSQNLVSTLLSGRHSNYEDRDVELGVALPAVITHKLEINVHPLIVLMRKGLVLTIHEMAIVRLVRLSRYANTFMKKIKEDIPWQDKLTVVLCRVIEENNTKNFDRLREIEEQADDLVKDLMDPTTPREKLGPEIYKMKHALIIYLDSLWATLDVIHTLRYGDAEVLTNSPKLLGRISLLANDVTNQISISEHMSEVLASGLEVLQSIYNNQLQILNNRLALVAAWLTVLGTAFLVPNTLATVFGIPAISEHLNWRATTIILAVSTIVSGLAAYWFVRSRRIMPKV